jgi:hypothetical protein
MQAIMLLSRRDVIDIKESFQIVEAFLSPVVVPITVRCSRLRTLAIDSNEHIGPSRLLKTRQVFKPDEKKDLP